MFGTDGVRGTPGHEPLDADTVVGLGAAVAAELGDSPRVVCGRDTRDSGVWLERQFAAGVHSEGGTFVSVGVMPTPGVSLIAASQAFDAGVVISASHNPHPDNGIKLLQATGEKSSREFEKRVEARVRRGSNKVHELLNKPAETTDYMDLYADHLIRIVGNTDLSGISLAVDCGHGATSEIAPYVMNKLGVSCVKLHTEPNGHNINQASGSTHPEALQRAVVEGRCQLGFGFDGDGDRVILVDRKGQIVDGDGVLFIAARYLQASNRLHTNGIVATVMSNFGLEVALAESGIQVHRCQVGDWHVREEMQRRGVSLGGEQSGHIIFSEFLPTGDGLATALLVLCMLVQSGQSLDELVADLMIFPQILLNIPVKKKRDIAGVPELVSAVHKAEQQLSGHGRVLVRYSGTELLLRIMVEGPEQDTVDRLAAEIATCAQERLV